MSNVLSKKLAICPIDTSYVVCYDVGIWKLPPLFTNHTAIPGTTKRKEAQPYADKSENANAGS